jgi:hypothetical protein
MSILEWRELVLSGNSVNSKPMSLISMILSCWFVWVRADHVEVQERGRVVVRPFLFWWQCHVAIFYCTMCHNLNHPNIKIKCLILFHNNNKIILIIKSWDMWQHIICSHCSPKKSRPNYKWQYVYGKSKDEGLFCWFFFSSKICCCLRLVSM